jgi:hypothetical protein
MNINYIVLVQILLTSKFVFPFTNNEYEQDLLVIVQGSQRRCGLGIRVKRAAAQNFNRYIRASRLSLS